MYYYNYQVAGLQIHCEIPFPLIIRQDFSSFFECVENQFTDASDIKVVFSRVPMLPPMQEGGHWEACRYHLNTLTEDRIYYVSQPKEPPYACVIYRHEATDLVTCQYLPGSEKYMNYAGNLVELAALEKILLLHNGILLHASFIRWKQTGILFSAPSGTGKSTQADLWHLYENADILNGDRAGLRCPNGSWQAYGLPYAGSSGIYRNESVPLRAIVILRQAKENRIQRLHGFSSVSFLYPEVSIHRWDRKFSEKALNLLLQLLEKIPVYLLECRPDQEAVLLLKETLLAET